MRVSVDKDIALPIFEEIVSLMKFIEFLVVLLFSTPSVCSFLLIVTGINVECSNDRCILVEFVVLGTFLVTLNLFIEFLIFELVTL